MSRAAASRVAAAAGLPHRRRAAADAAEGAPAVSPAAAAAAAAKAAAEAAAAKAAAARRTQRRRAVLDTLLPARRPSGPTRGRASPRSTRCSGATPCPSSPSPSRAQPSASATWTRSSTRSTPTASGCGLLQGAAAGAREQSRLRRRSQCPAIQTPGGAPCSAALADGKGSGAKRTGKLVRAVRAISITTYCISLVRRIRSTSGVR